jgi:hypothetical protein
MASKPLTVLEQRALAETMKDPGWAARMWDESAVEVWRRSADYVSAVRAVATMEERMANEAIAFNERQMRERAAFIAEQKRRMDGGQ